MLYIAYEVGVDRSDMSILVVNFAMSIIGHEEVCVSQFKSAVGLGSY